MKKTALITLSMITAVSVFAQGTITFVNNVTGSLKAPVYGVSPTDATFRQSGNDATGIPAGTANWTGYTKLAGTGFTVQLWAGPNANSLQGWNTSTFRTGTAAGIWNSVDATVGNVAPGAAAVIEVRVWDNAGGTITSWDQAITRGHSDQFTLAALGGTVPGGGVFLPPNLNGLVSFNLTTIPEPSIVGLGILGGLGLFLIRRRK